MHVGIVGFCGNRDAHDYEHSLIPIAIEMFHSFSVRPCSSLSIGHTPLDFSKHTVTAGYGSLFHYRRQTERTGAIKKNLIRLTIFPLMQYVYANGIRRTTQQKAVQYAGICWMQNAGGSASTTGPLRAICFLPQEVAHIELSHLPICPCRCFYGFLPMHTYLLCQTLSLDFILEQYLQWEICLQGGVGCLLLRLVHQSIESIRSHMQTLSQWV